MNTFMVSFALFSSFSVLIMQSIRCTRPQDVFRKLKLNNQFYPRSFINCLFLLSASSFQAVGLEVNHITDNVVPRPYWKCFDLDAYDVKKI